MTHSEGSCTLTYPDQLEDNVYWQRRDEICCYAYRKGLSIEDATKVWAGITAWSTANRETRAKIEDRAQRQQWLMVASRIPEHTLYRWAVEYESL